MIRVLGDMDVAEDSVTLAFAIAAAEWPATGVPTNPGGWITTTARNSAIDRLRRESTRSDRHLAAHRLQGDDMEPDHDPADRAGETQATRQPRFLPNAPGRELPNRLSALLNAIYLIYAEGHTPNTGASVTRADRSREAIRLGRVLVDLMPDEPEPIGLLALMLLTEARQPARTEP